MGDSDPEVVRALFDAWFRGDEAAQAALVDPEVVVTQFPEQPDVRPYHGLAGFRDVIADWIDTWDDYALEVKDVRQAGDHVLVALRQAGRGKASGARMEGDSWFVATVRGGKLVRLQMFSREEQAREAAAEPG